MFGHFPKEVLSAFYASFDEDGAAAAPAPAEKPTKASGMPKPKLGKAGDQAAAPTAEDPAAGAAKTIASPTALPADKQRAVNALGKKILDQD
jgi:hypothetical protein